MQLQEVIAHLPLCPCSVPSLLCLFFFFVLLSQIYQFVFSGLLLKRQKVLLPIKMEPIKFQLLSLMGKTHYKYEIAQSL